LELRVGLRATWPAAVKASIKKADRVSAWLEAGRIAGFAEAEANRLFGAPRLAGVSEMALPLRPPGGIRPADADYVPAY